MKGFAGDLFFMLVMFFVMAIIFVSAAFVAKALTNTGNGTIDQATTLAYQGTLQFDWIAPFMVVALGIALIGSSFLIRTQPIFFIGMFMLNLCFAYCSIFLANAWQGLFTNSGMAGTANLFTGWTIVFQYFPFIAIMLGVIFAIAIFAKGGE